MPTNQQVEVLGAVRQDAVRGKRVDDELPAIGIGAARNAHADEKVHSGAISAQLRGEGQAPPELGEAGTQGKDLSS